MKRRGKAILPNILFVVNTGKKKTSFSRNAIYSKKELQVIDAKEIVNETGLQLETGDKIIAGLQQMNGSSKIIIKSIIAKHQPVAISEKEYFGLLRIYINDKNQPLDLQELNEVLETILGITVDRMEGTPTDHHLIIDLSAQDPGTKRCPFIFPLDPGSYPLKIDFPQVSDETKRYLKMIYSNAKVTDTRIFAFRLVHFLLHKLGYSEHFSLEKIKEARRIDRVLQEGDPSQIPALEVSNVCLCDWESMHFFAIQPDLILSSHQKMLCDQCKKMKKHAGIGLKDIETVFETLGELSEPEGHFRKEKYIYYVVEKRKDGVIFNESPYKSKITFNVKEKGWNEIFFAMRDDLCNVFIPNELFDKPVELKNGDKVLIQMCVQTVLSRESRVETHITHAKINKTIKNAVKIINPYSLLSRMKPFRLSVTLKIGPETDLDFLKRVRKIVRRLTNWHVEIDKASYKDLESCLEMLTNIYEEWERANLTDKRRLIVRVHETIKRLPKITDVEDNFRVIVYIFPEKYAFIEDIFGTVASGLALHRTFAAVSIFPSVPPEYSKAEPCRSCESKAAIPFREEITSLFIIHEVLHIASGLEDHRNCSTCSYRRKEMQPFRRFYCEECIRKGNNQTHENCLMSYECLICISTRLLPESNLSDFLCKKCKKKLLPPDQFAARQVARMNSIIHHKLLLN